MYVKEVFDVCEAENQSVAKIVTLESVLLVVFKFAGQP